MLKKILTHPITIGILLVVLIIVTLLAIHLTLNIEQGNELKQLLLDLGTGVMMFVKAILVNLLLPSLIGAGARSWMGKSANWQTYTSLNMHLILILIAIFISLALFWFQLQFDWVNTSLLRDEPEFAALLGFIGAVFVFLGAGAVSPNRG